MLEPVRESTSPAAVTPPPSAEGRRPDEGLVAEVQRGDHQAFKLLFDRYYDVLCAFAERYVGEAESEEIVERLFVTLWARRASWVVRQGVRDYLFGAVRNEIRNHKRHARVIAQWDATRHPSDPVPGLGARPHSADERLYVDELEAALWRAVADLPSRRREAVTLRFRQAKSYAEIASQLHLSPKTVETHISRALQTLRQVLRQYL